jgi:hypothetical protein
MKSYSTSFVFRRALEDRLNAASKAEGVDLQRMRRQVAFDRLLVRLFAEGNPPWRLKGGYALELKLSVARTTRDLDLGLSAGMPPGERLLEALQTAAAKGAGDFFVYVIGEPMMDLDGTGWGLPESPQAGFHRFRVRSISCRKSMPTRCHAASGQTRGSRIWSIWFC